MLCQRGKFYLPNDKTFVRMLLITSTSQANLYEPDFQHAFWGTNYARLLAIKRMVDPEDVFWCAACVGNENWKEVNGVLCRV